jgi:hypothetical protein
MTLTNKQKREIEVLKYFIPKSYYREPLPREIEEFFNWSERGGSITEGNILALGKMWRDVHIKVYMEDIWMYGLMIFWESMGKFPPSVKEFLEKVFERTKK